MDGRQAGDPLRPGRGEAGRRGGDARPGARRATRAAPFTSLADFAGRVDPKLLNKMQVENLARAGAFDALEPNRAQLVAGAETVLRRAQASRRGRAERPDRPVRRAARGPAPLRLPEVPDWPQLDKLAYEAEAVGFHLSAHPLDTYKALLKRLGVTPFRADRGARPRRRRRA